MSLRAIAGILVALVVIGGGAIWYLIARKRRRESPHEENGPGYSRTANELEIRPLPAEQRDKFAEQWRAVQATFVDDPTGAVARADALVEEVMKARCYPVADFEQRLDDLSVDQTRFVDSFLAVREI